MPDFPSKTSASGRWSLTEAKDAQYGDLWPVQQFTGQQVYTTPGTYTWIAPYGVTSVSVVAVGGGGGGWASINTQYTISDGGDSSFNSTTVKAGGGKQGFAQNGGSSNVGGAGGLVINGTGTAGARGNYPGGYGAGGGGGAGLLNGSQAATGANADWSGTGGTGASIVTNGAGTVGTAGDIVGSGGNYGGGGGGGRDGTGGGGGAIAYANSITVVPGQSYTVIVGAAGSPKGAPDRGGGFGGPGAVRIIWGAGRSFPSTLIGDV